MAGRDHLLGLPSFVLAFRILQLVTALAIMGLAAYGITFLSFDGIDLTLFTVGLLVYSSPLFASIFTSNLARLNYSHFHSASLTTPQAIATLIITIYIIVAETGAPVIYNYWAILGLDIFAIVFWIISFSLLASEVAAYQIVTYTADDCYYSYAGVCYYKRSRALENLTKRATTNVYTYRNAMAAASGLGGLELYVVSLSPLFSLPLSHLHFPL
jgi:hypothetical protein